MQDIGLGVDTIFLAYTYNGEGNIIEVDTYLPSINVFRNYKFGDKINIFYYEDNMNLIKSDIHLNTAIKKIGMFGSLFISLVIGPSMYVISEKNQKNLAKVLMILIIINAISTMFL